MPRQTTLTAAQARAVAALHPAITRVHPDAVSGASPIIRVELGGRPAAIKLFRHATIHRNECHSLAALDGCDLVPRLLAHGEAGAPIHAPGPVDDDTPHGYWLCRTWIDTGDAHRLPLIHPARFAAELDRLVDACTGAQLAMADPKRANFMWDGRTLTWIDFGWFTAEPAAIAAARNRDFRTSLLSQLGW
jgi:hypothetical protein